MKIQSNATGLISTITEKNWKHLQKTGQSFNYSVLSRGDDDIKTVEIPAGTIDLKDIDVNRREEDEKEDPYAELDREQAYKLAAEQGLNPHPRTGLVKLIKLLKDNNIKT